MKIIVNRMLVPVSDWKEAQKATINAAGVHPSVQDAMRAEAERI